MSSATLTTIQNQINVYGNAFLMVMGNIGNVLIIMVFSQQHKSACSFYIMSAAVVNFIFLTINAYFQIFPFDYSTGKEPTDVTLDRYGNVYFVERGESRIQRINARDSTVETVVDKQGVLVFGTQYWNDPRNVAFDSKHNLYVADFKNFRVQKFLFEGGDLFC
ncbi:unnamed protein product [Adineta steineri]|uniref:Uncharacterized protein n=1 Tax=Adineta steineri TaxID=433720 RepID=A0A815BIN4_9BILA|nr:unnamed protein product [Adineta steineri]